MPVRPAEQGEYLSIDLLNQNGGINTKTDPTELTDKVPDAQNIIFDEEYGKLVKVGGSVLVSPHQMPDGGICVKQYVYKKENGVMYHIVQTNLNNVYWSTNLRTYRLLHSFTTTGICNFLTYNDYVWIINGIDTPIVWDGIRLMPDGNANPLILDGVGGDFDGQPKADLSRLCPKFIILLNERIFLLNTIDNKSEILFSRFYNEAGHLIKATQSAAWISSNQIIVGSDDGMEITAAAVFLGHLVVIKERAFYIIRGEFPNYSITKLPFNIGTYYNDTIKIMNNALYFLGIDGVYRFIGNAFEYVTEFQEELFKGLKTFLIKSFSRTITSQSDFEDATISNLATRGLASGILRLPRRLMDDTTADFNAGALRTNIDTSGNELKISLRSVGPMSVVGGLHRTREGNQRLEYNENNPQHVLDGSGKIHGVHLNARDHSNPIANTWAWVVMDLGNRLIDRIRINAGAWTAKASWSSRQTIRVSTFDSYTGVSSIVDNFFPNFTIHNGVNVVNVENRNILGSPSMVFDYIIGRPVRFLLIGVGSYGEAYSRSIFFTDVTSYSQLGRAEIIVSSDFLTSGIFISREFDTDCMDNNFNWAEFTADHHIPHGCSIRYELGTYSLSNTGNNWEAIADKQIIGTYDHNAPPRIEVIPTIARRRFMKYRITLTPSPDLLRTPVVHLVAQHYQNTGSWESRPIHIGEVSKWGKFLKDDITSGEHAGTIRYFRRVWSEGDVVPPYTEISHRDDYSAVVGTDLHTQLRIDIVRNSRAQVGPVVNGFNFKWLTGGNILRNASAIVYKNKYYLSLSREADHNDTIYAISGLNGAVEKYQGLNISDFAVWKDNRLLGTDSNASRIYELFKPDIFNFNNQRIEAYYDTKELIAGNPIVDMMLKEVYLLADTDRDALFEVDIFADKKYSATVSFEVANKEIEPKKRILPSGIIGKRFSFRVRNASKDETFRIKGLSVMIKILRTST